MASKDNGKDGGTSGGAKKQAFSNQTTSKADQAAKARTDEKKPKQADQTRKEPEKGKFPVPFDERTSDPAYKMRLCKNFSAEGSCKFGEKCLFAHGQHELRLGTDAKSTKPTIPAVTQAGIGSASEIREKNVEVFVCASCPDAYQDEVSNVCRNLGMQKAYGRAGDMLDSLSGKDWLGKWEAKVVMATVTKAHTLDARKARIVCISGGPHCDLEVAQQPRLVRAIKKEMDNEDFIVKVEWMEMRQFREDYAAGYTGVVLTVEGGSKPAIEKARPDAKSRPASAAAGDARGKQPSGEAGFKHAAGDAKGRHPASDPGGGKQQGNDGKGKPPNAEGKVKQAGGDAGRKQPGSPIVGDGGQGKKAGGKPELEEKPRQSPKAAEGDAGGKKGRDQAKGKQAGDDAAGGGGRSGAARPATADGRGKKGGDADGRPAGGSKRSAGAEAGKDRGPGRAWGCKQCGKLFPARYALVQHQSGTGHAGVTRGAPDAGKPVKDGPAKDGPAKDGPALTVWTCGECEREFATEAALDQHQTATGHSDPTCGCGRAFGSWGALQQHMGATGHDPMSSSEDSGDDNWADAENALRRYLIDHGLL
jgi:hypothetical protein